jgi:hypothetical protein
MIPYDVLNVWTFGYPVEVFVPEASFIDDVIREPPQLQ